MHGGGGGGVGGGVSEGGDPPRWREEMFVGNVPAGCYNIFFPLSLSARLQRGTAEESKQLWGRWGRGGGSCWVGGGPGSGEEQQPAGVQVCARHTPRIHGGGPLTSVKQLNRRASF